MEGGVPNLRWSDMKYASMMADCYAQAQLTLWPLAYLGLVMIVCKRAQLWLHSVFQAPDRRGMLHWLLSMIWNHVTIKCLRDFSWKGT